MTQHTPGQRRDYLSEAIRLATQTPYEAGYRDGLAHGRLLTDQGRVIDCLLAALRHVARFVTDPDMKSCPFCGGRDELHQDGCPYIAVRAAIAAAEKGEA